ncbi:PIG-L deacetylase family protein [Vibrio crassostreae]|uniref:PIG-L deacetylase family protein n=1 Tax=Vibrio crassostreae TaxID=246167 RepID=UPI001049805E|nr:PIG-L deacetylase family protein [Vibrio crassostreae]TCV26777.1 LmbE family N-acetylglucosaminyl deacetylase [Vibrio crassostreae]
MEIDSNSKILILAPHTDDGELGLGGTIKKLVDLGCKVYYIAFSAAEESIPECFDRNKTRQEVLQATSILGIESDNVKVLNFKVRHLQDCRQKILDELIIIRKMVDPDVIFVPSSDDIHQDHQAVNREGVRAFKNRTVLGYELIWNEFSFNSDLLISLTRSHIEAKFNALSMYETQSGRAYMSEEFIFGLAKSRGVQIGVEYAEAFEVIRCVIK